MKVAPTPPPWFRFGNGHCVGGPNAHGGTSGIAMCSMAARTVSENAANAQLIEQAPDMKLALRALAAGVARFEKSEFCFQGLRACVRDGDWQAVMNVIGRDRVENAIGGEA